MEKNTDFLFQTKQSKLDALRRKALALKATIAVEDRKEQRRRAKDYARLVKIVGTALLQQAATEPAAKAKLRQVLEATELDTSTRKFLASQGWL